MPVFDDQAFSDTSFSRESWLFSLLAAVRREVVRLASPIVRLITLRSGL